MRTFVATAFMLYGSATLLTAQDFAEACTAIRQVSVGQWSLYRMTAPQAGMQSGETRLAIVGQEDVDGEAHYWYEMSMTSQQGPMIVQFLVPSYPYAIEDVQGIVMKAGNQPAMKMPAQMLSMMQNQAGFDPGKSFGEECERAEVVGQESVTVPAGTFETLHMKASDGGETTDVWVAQDIPFGLIKVQGAQGFEMLLLERGADATSSITETPQTMPGIPRQ
jgi:hypothetical protein